MTPRSTKRELLAVWMLAACGGTPIDVPGESRQAVYSTSEAAGILAFVNDPKTTLERLDVDCRLYRDSAHKVVQHRNGKDKIYPSADDNPFDTLEELDAVPEVGPVTLEAILACAQSFGFLGFTLRAADVAGVVLDGAARFGLTEYAWQLCIWAAGEATACIDPCIRSVTAGGTEWLTAVVTSWVGRTYASRDDAVRAAADKMCQSSQCSDTPYTVTPDLCWSDPECGALGAVIGCMEG